MRRLIALVGSVCLLASLTVGTVTAGGPPSLSFYVDGAQYRTVGTPTDFTNTGAPASSFEAIYALGESARLPRRPVDGPAGDLEHDARPAHER
jgi:hypothetical protein